MTPCATRVPRPSKLSDPHFLLMEFPQFGHCRGVTPGRVFQPATKTPGIWSSMCSWRRVVDLPKANQLLKYKPEAVATLNSYANMCKQVCRNTISCCAQVEKQRRLIFEKVIDNLSLCLVITECSMTLRSKEDTAWAKLGVRRQQ